MKTEISDWNNNGVKLIKLQSDSLEVHLLSLGATIHSVIYPGAEEDLATRDVVLGFDSEAGYDGTDNPFFWGTTGRFTNRIKDGKFQIDGLTYSLSTNDFGNNLKHHLHGGVRSYDRLNWDTELLDSGDGVVFSILDPHGAEGYPGNVRVNVAYSLVKGCHLDIKITAETDKDTIINISNHVYFNLAGNATGWNGLKTQSLKLEAEKFTPDDEEYLPTGEIVSVKMTENDFTKKKLLSETVTKARGGEGYCVNFCVGDESKAISHVATLEHDATSRRLEVWSDQPGLELYTGNFLPEDALKGKGCARYTRWGGVCLMTQNYRDAANHDNFPPAVLRVGETYIHNVSYRFY